MSDHREVRRQILKILGLLPVTLALGCSRRDGDAEDGETPAVASTDLGTMVAHVGHRPATETVLIEEFADRLIAAPGGRYYVEAGAVLLRGVVNKLPEAISDQGMVDLAGFTPEERELLLRFVRQFYSYLEVRNQVSGEPVFGECQSDPLFYTRPT